MSSTDGKSSEKSSKPFSGRVLGMALALMVLVWIVYLPVRHCAFIWDDQDYVTENPTLRDLDGLRQIWFKPGVVPQYYPMVHTTFWIEYHLWGLRPLGYHWVNVALHGLSAALLFLLLRGLKAPGAWLAAALFAVHPIHVESVAWITERKNVLSMVFYLLSALAYLRFAGILPRWRQLFAARELLEEEAEGGGFGSGGWNFYAAALLLYVFALCSKTVTCSLPAALLLVIYWKRGRLKAGQILPLIPFFAVGLAFGLLTAWMERTRVGASGHYWDQTFVERCLIAGRALWFYAGKIVFPYPLAFVYPRWTIDRAAWLQYLYPIAAIALVGVLWVLRKRTGRAPLTAILFFGGTLFPALGFFNLYPMRYSFVADHFQYHASLGLIVLLAGGAAAGAARLPAALRSKLPLAAALLIGLLGAMTWGQVYAYQNWETVFSDTLAKNPDSTLALTTLAAINAEKGNREESVKLYRRAIALDDQDDVAHFNLGKILLENGETELAYRHLKRSIELSPKCSHCHYFYALSLSLQKRQPESIEHYRISIELNPKEPFQHYNYGVALIELGQRTEGKKEIAEALRLKPELVNERLVLIDYYMADGQVQEAENTLLDGLKHLPNSAELKQCQAALEDFKRNAPPQAITPKRRD